jgi:tetratricopeptide (TPR) repeat protein
MPLKYLFGPVDAAYADDNLSTPRAAGNCLAFNSEGDLDLKIGWGDHWEDLSKQLPADWTPDFIALFLPFTAIPDSLWSAPVPLVGLAGDWHLLWHQYRFALPLCDLVFSDSRGVEAFRQAGIPAETGNLFGCARSFLAPALCRPRDIDVLYVGSLHPAEQRERLPWLRRAILAAGDRSHFLIHTAASRPEYLELLGRSRILFNRSVRGECNLRVFEAAATGALLFQEAENAEVQQYLCGGAECVFYDEDNLEPLLQHYLENEEERSRIAAAAKRKVARFSFDRLWTDIVQKIERRLGDLCDRAAQRSAKTLSVSLAGRSWESLTSSTRVSPDGNLETRLIGELHRRLAAEPRAEHYNLLGLALARRGERVGDFNRSCAAAAVAQFRRAVDMAPGNALFRLNLAESLWRMSSATEAAHECRQALGTLDSASESGPDDFSGGHFPPSFDAFRIEWEKAAWSHPADRQAEFGAKVRLLRWRLHSILGALTGELYHYRCGAQLCDDLWVSHAALGRALLRAGEASKATFHLRRAHELSPFDDSLTDDLMCALRQSNDPEGQRQLGAELQLLKRAAGMNPPTEVRFAQEVTGAVW